jgi:hypothetical protein
MAHDCPKNVTPRRPWPTFLPIYLHGAHPAEPSRIANTRDIPNPRLAFGLPIHYRGQAQSEKMMIAFCMMGALAVLVFLSLSGEISNLFRRK